MPWGRDGGKSKRKIYCLQADCENIFMSRVDFFGDAVGGFNFVALKRIKAGPMILVKLEQQKVSFTKKRSPHFPSHDQFTNRSKLLLS